MSKPNKNWFKQEGLALLTDLYELTMMSGYMLEGIKDRKVCFEYFFRNLPPHNGFAITAGLEQVLNYLENLQFFDDDIEYLKTLKMFSDDFLSYLRTFKSTCTVRAMAEGTLVFPHEPIIQLEGSLFEIQLIESALLNIINYQTLIATKAARISLAANNEPVLEFGLRRAHGPDGGISGSRAAHIGGCHATSNVLAGKIHGIPVSGTHAHSWVMSFKSELEAFRAFVKHYPKNPVLLVDTYDTIGSGVPNAIKVFKELKKHNKKIRPAIRLDSGDLAKLSKLAHNMFVKAGFKNPLIIASNDLEEYLIADLKRQGAKINSWGVGTHMITSHDCPSFGGVYKLVATYENKKWIPKVKISSNISKATNPGRKKLIRYFNKNDQPLGDVMYIRGEKYLKKGTIRGKRLTQPELDSIIENVSYSKSMLNKVFENGKRNTKSTELKAIREYASKQIESLPEEYKRLTNPEFYKVILSKFVGDLKYKLIK